MPAPDLEILELSTPVSPDLRSQIRAIADGAESEDGVSPVNEEFWIRLDDGAASRLVLDDDGFAMAADGDLAVVVRPSARGHGLGRALAEAAMADTPSGPWAAWAHGDLPAARALLLGLGFSAERVLLRMGRTLEGFGGLESPLGSSTTEEDSLTVRPFRVGEDEESFLAANAAAFASHPEQGRLDLDGLRARTAQPWFDASGLLLAEEDGRLLGFHWTKRETPEVGEVYVLGLVPEARGRGLARVLLAAGLAHLADMGATEVELYVDQDNTDAVALYERYGFTELSRDVRYAKKVPS